MSQDNDKISPDEGDSQVSDLYRELAAERPSKAMDRAVLEEAASAAVTRKYWSSAWFRPLAFVATVALSFAVVLEISRVDQPEAPASRTSEAAKIQHAAPPEDEQRQAPIAGNDATFRQRKSSAADSPAVDSAPLQLKEAEPPGRVDSKVETKNFAGDIVERNTKLADDFILPLP